jgi:hypothetical protein
MGVDRAVRREVSRKVKIALLCGQGFTRGLVVEPLGLDGANFIGLEKPPELPK